MKQFIGTVTSNKMQKTVVVTVEKTKKHRLYGKTLRSKKNFHAHDEIGVKIGDRVKIQSVRPLSKLKKFKVVTVLK